MMFASLRSWRDIVGRGTSGREDPRTREHGHQAELGVTKALGADRDEQEGQAGPNEEGPLGAPKPPSLETSGA